MEPSDALFSVRVISDSHSWIGAIWAALLPLASVALGGWITYRATAGNDSRKERRETYVLARSLAAELRAGQVVVKIHRDFYQSPDTDNETRADTLRFGKTYDKALPVAKSAAANAGKFAAPVAEELAKFLLLAQNVTQLQDIIARMREAGALTDEKLLARLKLSGLIGEQMISCGKNLADLLDRHYPEKST